MCDFPTRVNGSVDGLNTPTFTQLLLLDGGGERCWTWT